MRLNRKGFTLVELLVTIVVVGLVIGLSTFGIIHLIKNSKDKVVVLSENNLKEAARIYSTEASNDSWKKNDNFDAFCVTIGELMNKGLLNEKAKINGKLTRNDLILVKRNKITLAVEGEEIVSGEIGEESNKICTGQENKNENITAPQISGYNSYTDRIEVSFNPGETKDADSSIEGYRCLYGETSSNINREGTISNNKCILSGLKKNNDYYVYIYMNTTKGSSILATGNREYKTKDFVSQNIVQNKNVVTITFDDTNIYNNASHYFSSTVSGTSNSTVEKCILKNNKFTCSESTNNIDSNTWYRVSGSSAIITYAEKDNDIDVIARIEDGSNNYREDKKNIKIRKYTVKFYKNKASSIDGKTSEYVEKYCISDGNSTCSVTAPGMTVSNGYSVVGYNTSSSATSSTWNVSTSKEISSNLSYYAIVKAIVYTISYELNGGTVSGNPTSYTIESNDITLKNPTKTGYTFAGWTGSNGTTKQTSVKIVKGSTGNKSYTANWSANSYTYNVVYKSSSGVSLGTATMKKEYGTTNTVSPKTFTGYTSPSSQTVKWDSTSAKTITFTYTPTSYTITYKLNGGTNNSNNPSSYTIETSDITLKSPSKTGYTFAGWTGSNGTTKQTSVKIAKGSTGNKSYTANWSANSYTYNVVYKSSSGVSLGTATIKKEYGTTNTVNPKTFTGYTSPSSQTIKWDSTSAKTITFTYTPTSYTISYTLNGGAVSGNPTSYNIETSDITLKKPTKSGYIFDGWTGSNGTTKQTSVKIVKGSTGNKSYTANWSEEEVLTTVNKNRFSCESSDRLAVYYVTTCNDTTCSYTKKNGLSSDYSFDMDVIGVPTWRVESKNIVDDVANVWSITTNGNTCNKQLLYVTASVLNCRAGASADDSVPVKTTWEYCIPLYVYRTTKKYDSVNNWWYSSTYDCYLSGEYLQSYDPCYVEPDDGDDYDEPDPPYVEPDDGGGGDYTEPETPSCTSGRCRCQQACNKLGYSSSDEICYYGGTCYCCPSGSDSPCIVGGGVTACITTAI